MAPRKLHILWANGETYCGRIAGADTVPSPDARPNVCASCSKAYYAAHGGTNPYNTAGNPL